MSGAGFWPYSTRIINSVVPYGGFISSSIHLLYGAGDAVMTKVGGQLIDRFGAEIQPYFAFGASALCFPLIVISLLLVRKYEKIQSEMSNDRIAEYMTAGKRIHKLSFPQCSRVSSSAYVSR